MRCFAVNKPIVQPYSCVSELKPQTPERVVRKGKLACQLDEAIAQRGMRGIMQCLRLEDFFIDPVAGIGRL